MNQGILFTEQIWEKGRKLDFCPRWVYISVEIMEEVGNEKIDLERVIFIQISFDIIVLGEWVWDVCFTQKMGLVAQQYTEIRKMKIT